ncbi:hypothetical protein ABBQ38_000808 [Trebouxia sp. C0009 RCD-2024]
MGSSIKHGTVSQDQLQQYMQLEQHPLIRYLLYCPGMKERLLGDSAFLAKLAIEVGMGMVTKIIAELEQREEKFLVELYLVIANVFMSLITDIMLLWIPAPRANLSTPALGVLEQQKQSPTLQPCYQFWATCPANAFQVSQHTLEAILSHIEALAT